MLRVHTLSSLLLRAIAVPIASFLLSTLAVTAHAGDLETKKAPTSYTVISPIFSQLVAFSHPMGFMPVFENTRAGSYIREAVLNGESVEKWTQMITVTGAKDLSKNPQATPEAMVGLIAGGFKKSCPESFSAVGLGAAEVALRETFAAVVSCGSLAMGGDTHRETALIVAIKGANDYYTIQWAERAKASAQPQGIDEALWRQRLALLGPIRLCAIVKGEKAPYPSCIGSGFRKQG